MTHGNKHAISSVIIYPVCVKAKVMSYVTIRGVLKRLEKKEENEPFQPPFSAT